MQAVQSSPPVTDRSRNDGRSSTRTRVAIPAVERKAPELEDGAALDAGCSMIVGCEDGIG
jgi:hypothetical protein